MCEFSVQFVQSDMYAMCNISLFINDRVIPLFINKRLFDVYETKK